MKPRLVLFGTSTFGVPSFTVLANDQRFEIATVVSQPARPVGRKQLITDSPVSTWAKTIGLPLVTPVSLKKPEPRRLVADIPADLYVVASYGLILPADVLALPSKGAINIHASLLPKYRGASPISAAIVAGDTASGITFMQMDPGLDTGPMLQQLPLPLRPDDTKQTLEQNLGALAADHIGELVKGWLAGSIVPTPQPADGVSLAPKLRRDDGHAHWDNAILIERMTRAYSPWPGVWAKYGDREMRIIEARVDQTLVQQKPGTVVAHGTDWAVSCTNGLLVPTIVQFAGRKPQPAATIPGSYPGFVGAVLD